MQKIKADIEKSWNGRYYTIKIPISDISYEVYQKIGTNLTIGAIEYGLQQGSKYDQNTIKYTNDITCCYYDYKQGIACFSSSSIENIQNWLKLYSDIIYIDNNKFNI